MSKLFAIGSATVALLSVAFAENVGAVTFDPVTVKADCSVFGEIAMNGRCYSPSQIEFMLGGRGSGGRTDSIGGRTTSIDGPARETFITSADVDVAAPVGCGKGNPIFPATGNKIENELDFASSGEMPLELNRSYNHHWKGVGLFGKHWISNFDYKLTFGTTEVNPCYPRPGGGVCGVGSNTSIFAWRPDGRIIKFVRGTDGLFHEEKPESVALISVDASGFTLIDDGGQIETYSPAGYIQSISPRIGVGWVYTYDGTLPTRITHSSGRYVELIWAGSQLTTVRDPAGSLYRYTYTPNVFGAGLHRLASAIMPGHPTTTVEYHYEMPNQPGALTGKSVGGARYSKFSYDANGYATSTEHNGVEKYSFQYTRGPNGLMTVVETNPLGKQTTYTFENTKLRQTTGHPSGYCPATSYAEVAYDTNGYPKLKSDFNGNRTAYSYNAKGQLLEKVEGVDSPFARTTRYVWDSEPGQNRIISETVVGLGTKAYEYNATGKVSRVSWVNSSPNGVPGQSRTTSFNYEYDKTFLAFPDYYLIGRLKSLQVDGPIAGAGDAAVWTYDELGNLSSVSTPLGVITYSNFNGLGQPGRVVSVNGAVTDQFFDERGRPTIVRTYVNGAQQDTVYTYDGAGRLRTVKTPDGRTVTRDYDQSWRLEREYSREASGKYEVVTYGYNANSQVTSRVVDRTDVVAAPVSAPSLSVPASSYSGGYAVSWSPVDTAANYNLEQQSSGGVWASLGSVTGLSQALNGQPAGAYSYRVSACNRYGCGVPSNVGSIQVTYPPTAMATISLPAQVATSSYAVNWSAVATATSYRPEESVNGGAWVQLPVTSGAQVIVSGRGPGTYSYRVTACNVAGCGPVSAVATTSRVDAPASAPALQAPSVNATGSYTVSWSPVAGSTYYLLDESVAGSAWAQVANTGANSVGFSGKNTSTTASYRARACNAVGCSPYSGVTAVQAIAYGANYIGQSVPVLVAAGKPFNVSWQMQNTGNTTWTSSDAYSLGSVGDSFTWGTHRVGLAAPVAPGGTATIAATLTAPAAAGTYSFQWRMVRDGYTWFGVAAPNVVVTVASGSISGSPNPCKLYVGETTCTVTLSWQSSRADAEVWVTNLDGSGPQLFARAQSGTQAATWITTSGTRFHLKSGGVTLSTVDVSAYQSGESRPVVRPPLPEEPCPKGTRCQIR